MGPPAHCSSDPLFYCPISPNYLYFAGPTALCFLDPLSHCPIVSLARCLLGLLSHYPIGHWLIVMLANWLLFSWPAESFSCWPTHCPASQWFIVLLAHWTIVCRPVDFSSYWCPDLLSVDSLSRYPLGILARCPAF
jgi:hypothetical protein